MAVAISAGVENTVAVTVATSSVSKLTAVVLLPSSDTVHHVHAAHAAYGVRASDLPLSQFDSLFYLGSLRLRGYPWSHRNTQTAKIDVRTGKGSPLPLFVWTVGHQVHGARP